MKEHNHWIEEEKLREICYDKALWYLENATRYTTLTDPNEIAELLYNGEIEKYQRDLEIEKLLSYDDEIIEIIELDEMELIDITVGNDNLFFANDILTKNSSGHFMTADFMIGLISTAESKALGQVRLKQFKNRYGSVDEFETFILNMDRKKMRVFQDDLYTRNNQIAEPAHKAIESIIPQKSKYEKLRGLNS